MIPVLEGPDRLCVCAWARLRWHCTGCVGSRRSAKRVCFLSLQWAGLSLVGAMPLSPKAAVVKIHDTEMHFAIKDLHILLHSVSRFLGASHVVWRVLSSDILLCVQGSSCSCSQPCSK